jgi:hypothetical protein
MPSTKELMKKLYSRRLIPAVGIGTAILVFFAFAAGSLWFVSAQSSGQSSARSKDSDRHLRQSLLSKSLASQSRDEFRAALKTLAEMDEPGAMEVWRSALKHPDANLRREAWQKYRDIAPQLIRKEMVPQVARISASSEEFKRIAENAQIEATIWQPGETFTVAAAPPYLIDILRQENIPVEILHESIADWQQARKRGDAQAKSITPDYLSESADEKSQVHIVVIDNSRRGKAANGYAEWSGDHENVLFSNKRYLAYLDISSSITSSQAIGSHIEENYTKRGQQVVGFYTTEEFSGVVSRFFPGERFSSESEARNKGTLRPALAEGVYHTYEETLAEFNQLAQSHPDIARVVNLGQSFEGRQIFALKITKSPEANNRNRPDILITGCHHAREWISVEPPVYFANQLVTKYSTDDGIKHLVDNLQIWIVPIVNPDGLTYSQGAPNDSQGSIRLWRKNRRPVSADGCASDMGVDLNRNYDFQWRLPGDEPCPRYNDDIGGSDDPGNEIYRGLRAESEPEIKALKTLMDDPDRKFRAQLDYHNFSQLVLYPWGYKPFPTPDEDHLAALGAKMVSEIFSVDRKIYKARRAIELYSTTGSSVDYAYGANQVAAPFIIEMRPFNGLFNVPENQIDAVNRENWAGALYVMKWAAGPPLLKSVKAYQVASNGTFSKLVYSGQWIEPSEQSGGARQFIVDTRLPVLDLGPIQIHLQFSKSMNRSSESPIKVTLGRGDQFDELKFAIVSDGQGWQRTEYENDTWVGEVIIPFPDEITAPWRLAVSATDLFNSKLDANPETVAGFVVGTDQWGNYEDAAGEGHEGGIDIQHRLSPTVRDERPGIVIGAPRGGERVAGGDSVTVEWTVLGRSVFVPSEQEIWLSTNGGVSFTPLSSGIPGAVEKFNVTMPLIATTGARLRISAREAITGNTLFSEAASSFTIAANVNSAIGMDFVSSEKLTQSWTDQPLDGSAASSGSLRLGLTINVTNRGTVPLADPFLRVSEVTREHVLLSRDLKSRPTVGARQSVDVGEDKVLMPGETVQVKLLLGLIAKKKFNFSVELYAAPVEGIVNPGNGFRVWTGKPKSK